MHEREPSGILVEPSGILVEPSGILAEPSGILVEPSGILVEPSAILAEPSGILWEPYMGWAATLGGRVGSSLLARPCGRPGQPGLPFIERWGII